MLLHSAATHTPEKYLFDTIWLTDREPSISKSTVKSVKARKKYKQIRRIGGNCIFRPPAALFITVWPSHQAIISQGKNGPCKESVKELSMLIKQQLSKNRLSIMPAIGTQLGNQQEVLAACSAHGLADFLRKPQRLNFVSVRDAAAVYLNIRKKSVLVE